MTIEVKQANFSSVSNGKHITPDGRTFNVLVTFDDTPAVATIKLQERFLVNEDGNEGDFVDVEGESYTANTRKQIHEVETDKEYRLICSAHTAGLVATRLSF